MSRAARPVRCPRRRHRTAMIVGALLAGLAAAAGMPLFTIAGVECSLRLAMVSAR